MKEGYVVDRDTITEAQIKDLNNQSAVNLTNERFLVPEILFTPTDIGINQLGISEIIKQITSKRVPSAFEHIMFSNIVIGGGNTKTIGFKQRLENDILNQGLMTDMARTCKIFDAEKSGEKAANGVWRGMKEFAKS